MKRRTQTVMPAVALNRRAAEPLYRQLFQSMRQAIVSGMLAPGSLLPASRALADQLSVSRNTIVKAYDELSAGGWVTGKAGSGTRVRGPSRTTRIARPNLSKLLRESHYPADALPLCDPDGNVLHIHR